MLRYAALEEALAHHLRVAPENRPKFRNRIKQLQRAGWPRGSNNEHRARVSYTAQQLLELAFVFELIELGLPPERAIRLVEFWWNWLRRAFLRARRPDTPDTEIVFAFLQGNFSGLLADQDSESWSEDATATIGIDQGESPDKLRQTLKILTRARGSFFNVTAVLRGLTEGLNRAGVESAFVWAETEAWLFEVDENGAPLDPKKVKEN